MRYGVRWPVGRQEEAVDAGNKGVPLGCAPKLEEVEDRQRSEEEGHTPNRAACEESDGKDAAEAPHEGYAQTKGSKGDACQGLWLAGEVGLEDVVVVSGLMPLWI